MLGWKVNPTDEYCFPSIQKMIGAIDFLATQQGEQHFRITDVIDITGENITVENDEIGKFSEAQCFKAAQDVFRLLFGNDFGSRCNTQS